MSIRIDPDKPKYALIKLDKIREMARPDSRMADAVQNALATLEMVGALDMGTERENEFFVLRLRDQYSDDALYRYSLSARYDGESDYALQVEELAGRAGVNHPNCKKPD